MYIDKTDGERRTGELLIPTSRAGALAWNTNGKPEKKFRKNSGRRKHELEFLRERVKPSSTELKLRFPMQTQKSVCTACIRIIFQWHFFLPPKICIVVWLMTVSLDICRVK